MKWNGCLKVRLMFIVAIAIWAINPGVAVADFTFGEPTHLGPVVNSTGLNTYPSLSADGLSLYLCSGGDLFATTRETTDANWGPPLSLGPGMNSPQDDWAPHLSADGLELYFTSKRPGGDVNGRDDIWVAKRASLNDGWGTPVNLGPLVNTDNWDTTPFLSQDGLTLYFTSGRWNEFHQWVATDLYTARRKTLGWVVGPMSVSPPMSWSSFSCRLGPGDSAMKTSG